MYGRRAPGAGRDVAPHPAGDLPRICTGWRRAMSQAINLALQGGGAHGAFTWGALDRILEETSIAHRGNHRHLRGRDERHRPQARLGAGWPRRRADGAREVLAAGRRARRRHRRGDARLAPLPLAFACRDLAAARVQPRRARRRRHHPRALALPVQPGQLPSAARHRRGDGRHRKRRLDPRPQALRLGHQRPRRTTAHLSGPRDHHGRHPRLGLPADALPGDRDRRREDRPPRGLLGRRLHGQPGPLPAPLPHQGRRTSSSSTSTRSIARSCRERRGRS